MSESASILIEEITRLRAELREKDKLLNEYRTRLIEMNQRHYYESGPASGLSRDNPGF